MSNNFISLSMAAVLLVSTAAFSVVAGNDSAEFELSQDDYLSKAFNGQTPLAERVWIRGELKSQLAKILQHPVGFLRTRYWRVDDTSVWILDEIGKEKPITTAITVQHTDGRSRITDVKVLAFRETRGWEVKYPFFTMQFEQVARAKSKRGLNKSIDGITGATLSVRALKKVAEIALLLDEHVRTTSSDI